MVSEVYGAGQECVLYRLNPCCNGRWSRRFVTYVSFPKKGGVLILVVMEDGLGDLLTKFIKNIHKVLILVVMEDGLGG